MFERDYSQRFQFQTILRIFLIRKFMLCVFVCTSLLTFSSRVNLGSWMGHRVFSSRKNVLFQWNNNQTLPTRWITPHAIFVRTNLFVLFVNGPWSNFPFSQWQKTRKKKKKPRNFQYRREKMIRFYCCRQTHFDFFSKRQQNTVQCLITTLRNVRRYGFLISDDFLQNKQCKTRFLIKRKRKDITSASTRD